MELDAHLEGKAARLRCEGLGKVKVALVGTNTSFLLDILEGCFGQQDPDTSQSYHSLEEAETDIMVEDVTSNIPEKTLPPVPVSGGLASAQLVFPLKSVPTVIAGIPDHFCLFVVLKPFPCIAVHFPPAP